MSAEKLLADLLQLGLHLWADKDELCFRGPKGALSPILRESIAQDKKRLLELLGPDGNKYALTTSAQQRLWFLDQYEQNGSLYNIGFAYRLKGALDVTVLERSLFEIARRQESLRTTFIDLNGQPVQVIAAQIPLELNRVDLSDYPPSTRETEAHQRISNETNRSFDLSRGPLFRTMLLRLDETEHILMLTMHHIISDGWSLGIFNHEFAAIYRSILNGESSPLGELPAQYADFATWQRQWLQGETLESQMAYWKAHLAAPLPVLSLPTDRPRPAIQTFNGAVQKISLPVELVRAIKSLGESESATLFMTLLAAFKTLLYRYSGQADVVVGVPIANRNRIEIEGIIGLFANTLVLRSSLEGNPGFRELLKRVREVALNAYAHQEMPLEKLVEELNPPRDLSHSPFFQVLFSVQNTHDDTLTLPELAVAHVTADLRTAKFDLSLYLWETRNGMDGALEYNTDLFDPATAARMLTHYQTLLEGIVVNPDQYISDLPLLTRAEQHQILVDWNNTSGSIPDGVGLHDLFAAQANRVPDSIALSFENQNLTYRELDQRANQIAHHLQHLEVGAETLVAICVERSPEMILGLLGILKSGGAYLPLDPAFPQERLAFMLEDSKAPVLVTEIHLLEQFRSYAGQIVCLDRDRDSISRLSPAAPVSATTSDPLAYTIYTSGSTGKPKGVQIGHRAVVNFLEAMRRSPGLSEQDTLLSVTTFSFDIAALEIFLPLTAGARLVLASREVAGDGLQLMQALENHPITVMQATPATWRMLLEAGWRGDGKLKILCGGEAFPRELADQLLTRSASVWNMYGPTETTIWSSVHRVEKGSGSLPIGRPILNTQFYILDEQQPVPVGVPGELCIAGAGLARGYLNRPELTAEKFLRVDLLVGLDNASVAGSLVRIYRTGDLVRYLPDGNIEFLGRSDQQVKIRGFRIELGEIEAILSSHPAVREAVVIAREDMAGGKQLVGYLIARPAPALDTNELRSFLKEKLPDYMIPAAYVVMEAFPLTANGKINRRALPAPEQSQPQKKVSFIAPSTPFDEILAEIFGEVLHIEKIGILDNFFELGGHSLLATQIMSRVRDRFEITLPVRRLFEAPTIAELAPFLEQALVERIKAMQDDEKENILNS